MKKLFASFFAMVLVGGALCAGSAQAYSINFDWMGSGSDANLIRYDSFQLNSVNNLYTFEQDATGLGTSGDYITGDTVNSNVFTVQEKDGSFSEKFIVQVVSGIQTADLANNFFNLPVENSLFVELDLQGKYYADDDIRFTAGTAKMYNSFDDDIMTFVFNTALVSQLTGSLLSDYNLGMKIDFNFKVDSLNGDYWGDYEEYLVGNEWLFSVAAGRIDQTNIWTNADEQLIIGWTFPGAKMEFAVPEPSSILLLGFGLLGLAAANRRKMN